MIKVDSKMIDNERCNSVVEIEGTIKEIEFETACLVNAIAEKISSHTDIPVEIIKISLIEKIIGIKNEIV